LAEHGLAVLYALFLWWFSTGLVFYLVGLPARTFRWSLLGTSLVAAAALLGLAWSSTQPTVAGAYLAFTCGLLVWGWHEVSFLMGFITGGRRPPCPEGCGGWRHFWHATHTILHHELAILATALLVAALSWSGANQTGMWTFMLLWWLRLSAKLNVFLGVSNLSEDLLPDHLQYLKRFFAKKPINLLFPVSVTGATIAAALLAEAAVDAPAGAFQGPGLTLLATLLALAILEHWFLVLPLRDAALWRWALRARAERAGAAARPEGPGPAALRPLAGEDRPGRLRGAMRGRRGLGRADGRVAILAAPGSATPEPLPRSFPGRSGAGQRRRRGS
jgi:putative photosynthetic complex assembly protein 2